MIFLPGTKNTIDDLLWMRQNGLEAAVLKLAHRQVPVWGICGGYQMMGEVPVSYTHLLVLPGEIENLREQMRQLADSLEKHLD